QPRERGASQWRIKRARGARGRAGCAPSRAGRPQTEREIMRTKIAVSAALGVGLVFGAGAPALSSNLSSPDAAKSADITADVVPGQELERISDGRIEKGETAYVDVTVATLWADRDAPRKVDKPALGHPVDLDKWNKNLKSTDVRRGLTGKTETQAVYGSEVTVLDIKGDWAEVSVKDQKTPKNEKGYP